MLYIKSEAYLSERGTYDINEDALITVKEKLYLVCDGVGGNGNGLLAAQLLCNTIATLIQKEPILNLSAILEHAEKVFSNYKKRHPITQLMASTIAFVQINNGFVTIAWIGDTSVYQIRGGKIIYKTVSHTLIQEAIQSGQLTELESYFHPNSNQLTRSVKGTEYPTEFESFICEDIQDNDHFLLCSDGIQESWIDSDVEDLFRSEKNSKVLIEKIKEQCAIFSTDNYSAIVIQLGIQHK
jgi:protein phosphatase